MRNLFVPSLLGLALAACAVDDELDTSEAESAVEGLVGTFDPVLQAPKCATPSSSCDSGTLVNGRGPVGPEPNAPNTINDSCADGTLGSYHFDESIDRITVSTLDGTPMAPGKTVQIQVTAWVYTSFTSDHLDLYFASDATNPSWTYLTTITPPGSGLRVMTAQYTLPQGQLQAVRGNFRYLGSQGTCSIGGFDDRDDLVFAVQSGPSASFTYNCDIFGDCQFTDTSTDPGNDITSWSWTFGDGGLSGAQNPLHTYFPGTYTATLTVTDATGLSSAASQDITIIDPGVPPDASFTVDCTDISCLYVDTSTDADNNITSWLWDFGDGTTSTDQNPHVHHYQVAGTYVVTLTVTDAVGFSAVAEEWVTVVAPTINLSANGFMFGGKKYVNLTWSGATAAEMDVWQDGVIVGTTANDGSHRVQVTNPGTTFYSFFVCHAGTFACSNEANPTI